MDPSKKVQHRRKNDSFSAEVNIQQRVAKTNQLQASLGVKKVKTRVAYNMGDHKNASITIFPWAC